MACGSLPDGNPTQTHAANPGSRIYPCQNLLVAAVFTTSGVLDEAGFQSLVRHLLTVGAPALTLFGLAIEFYKLTDHERSRM
jgi:hypothetical protein